jgi:hypothetical protein
LWCTEKGALRDHRDRLKETSALFGFCIDAATRQAPEVKVIKTPEAEWTDFLDKMWSF